MRPQEERVGLLGSPPPLRGQKVCASDGRVGENGAPGRSFSENVWREIEALAAEAQNFAERGFNPRTFGLRAQHANHCATPLWFAEIFESEQNPTMPSDSSVLSASFWRGRAPCAFDGGVQAKCSVAGCVGPCKKTKDLDAVFGNVSREIEVLAAEAQDLAERFVDPRTFGL